LTAPSEYNTLSYTEKRIWVEEHLGMDAVKKLIISPNKALSIGDYLIDDKASGKGQDGFTGRLIQIGSKEFPNWESISSFFSAVHYCECCPVDAQ
jgi:5'(3')-deoxyribonucleotidase